MSEADTPAVDGTLKDPRHPNDVHFDVLGTVEELEEAGMDPALFGSCSKPIKGIRRGCPQEADCPFSCKGVSGPRMFAVEILKGPSQGGGMVVRELPCMSIARQKKDIEGNQGVVTVIAQEGETYKTIEGICFDPATGKEVPHVPGTKQQRKDAIVERTVKAFPRIGQNQDILTEQLRAQSVKARMQEVASERRDRSLGIPVTPKPLDERGEKRGRGGRREDPPVTQP